MNGNTYIGDWMDDKRHGNGKYVYYSTDESYEGEWKEGMKHGRGIALYAYGETYKGDFR